MHIKNHVYEIHITAHLSYLSDSELLVSKAIETDQHIWINLLFMPAWLCDVLLHYLHTSQTDWKQLYSVLQQQQTSTEGYLIAG